MKTTRMQTIFLTILCLLTACNLAKSKQTQPSGAILRRHPFRGAVDACRRSPYSPLE